MHVDLNKTKYGLLLEYNRDAAYGRFLQLAASVQAKCRANYMAVADKDFPFMQRMRALLSTRGLDGSEFDRVVLVGGSHGKGTLTARLQSLLSRPYRVGAFLSPAVLSWCETILTNVATPITPAALTRHYESLLTRVEVAPWLEEFGYPSHFEMMVVVALAACLEARCDVMLLEVGCGGLNDATNAVRHEGAVITDVGLEHQQLLGSSRLEIARQKAGIIPKEGWLFTAANDPEVVEVLRETADAKQSQFRALPTSLPTQDNGCQRNQQLAKQVAEYLRGKECNAGQLEGDSLLPARYDLLMVGTDSRPRLIVDGAHSPDKCRVLAAQLRRDGVEACTLLLAAGEDKDVAGMLHHLDPLTREYGITSVGGAITGETMNAEKLAAKVRDAVDKPIKIVADVASCLDEFIATAEPKQALLVTGSFIIAAEALRFWCALES